MTLKERITQIRTLAEITLRAAEAEAAKADDKSATTSSTITLPDGRYISVTISVFDAEQARIKDD